MIKSVCDEASDDCQPRIDKLLRVCAALTNVGDGIVYKEDFCPENVNVSVDSWSVNNNDIHVNKFNDNEH